MHEYFINDLAIKTASLWIYFLNLLCLHKIYAENLPTFLVIVIILLHDMTFNI